METLHPPSNKSAPARGRRRLRILLLACLCVTAALLTACGGNGGESESAHAGGSALKVTATIGMITDVVRQIGGEHVEVTGLMKSNVDPHLFKASHGDIQKLDDADIIFYNGLHLEGKMVDVLEKMAARKPTVAVAERIDPAELRSGAENGMDTEYDPHVWFDVSLWMSAAGTIRDTLIEQDPEHEADYRTNAEAYLAELQRLDEEVAEKIRSLPEPSRVLVTAHDAFGYFGDAYGMTVMGLQGISTASEAGTKDVRDLRDYLVRNKIKAVFIESSVPRKAIDAVIQGAKEQGHDLAIGGELFSDAMGEEGTPEGTYVGMIRHNVDTIVNALK